MAGNTLVIHKNAYKCCKYKPHCFRIQSNRDANSKARARSWRLLKLEEAIAHREAGKYPISSDILDKTIDELKEILSAEK